MDEAIKKIGRENVSAEDLGFIMWKLESIENFLPYVKSIMKKEEK